MAKKRAMMKRILMFTAMVMGIMNFTTTQQAHAIFGLAFKSKPVKIVGAVGMSSGLVLGTIGFATAVTAATTATTAVGAVVTVAAGIVTVYVGAALVGIGLIILDENKIADIEFKAVDPNHPESYPGFSREQVEVYNSELAQLNSIRQTMIAESNDEADTADAEVLWKEYAQYLNPSTVAIAEYNAAMFLKAIHY